MSYLEGLEENMKLLKIILSLYIIFLNLQVSQASTLYNYTPIDDLNWNNSNGIAINTVGSLSSYNMINGTNLSIPYLKFDTSNIKDKLINNVSLRLQESGKWGSGDPALKLYLVENDNWSEGEYYYSQGQVGINLADYAAFTTVNRAQIKDENYLTIGYKSGEWYECQFDYKNLSDNIKTGLSDGTISFAILQYDPNSSIELYSQETQGDIIEVIKQSNNGIFARVEALPNLYSPQMIVNADNPAPTPEPSSLILGTLSVLGLMIKRRKL
jgi:hypothetical protein